MKTIWFMDLPKDEQDGFKREVKSAKNVLEKLEQIVQNRNDSDRKADDNG